MESDFLNILADPQSRAHFLCFTDRSFRIAAHKDIESRDSTDRYFVLTGVSVTGTPISHHHALVLHQSTMMLHH